MSLKNKFIFVFIAILAFAWPQQVLAGDLVKFNFQVKPTLEDFCLANTAYGNDNLGNAGSTTTITQVGDADCSTLSTTPISAFAIDLVNAVAQYCGSFITSSNYTCIADHIPPSATYPDRAYGEIVQSTITFGGGYYQCVGFVSTAIAAVTGQTDFTVGGGGCAAELAGRGPAVPQGVYRWIPSSESATIQPGDFPVWTNGCGHIAVVIQVQGNYSFTVGEALGTNGSVQTRTFLKSQVPGWLRAI